jgi:hypothetical protein
VIPGVEVDPPTRMRGVDWAEIVDWCLANPGRARRFDGVYSNAPYALRKRYPRVKVTSESHHMGDEGKRVCTMWIVYEPWS